MLYDINVYRQYLNRGAVKYILCIQLYQEKDALIGYF